MSSLPNIPNNPFSPYKRDPVAISVDVRDEILGFIAKNPGIRYRELLRLAGISNGVLTYHLGMLEKFGDIKVQRQSNNRVTRYFVSNVSKLDYNIIGYFRSSVTRNIMIFLLQNELCTFNEIVDHVGKAPSTISWHVKKLRGAGLLGITYGDNRFLYKVTNRDAIINALLKYKETFADRVIDNYTEMVDKL